MVMMAMITAWSLTWAYETAQGGNCCPWDMDDDGAVGIEDALIFYVNWGTDPGGPPDFDCDGDVDEDDEDAFWDNWGACDPLCGDSTDPLSLPDALDAACLTMDDWNAYVGIMKTGTTAEKENYQCWMVHYIHHCNKCICQHIASCPDDDPFDG